MAAQLRYVDPTRTPGLFARSYAALAASRFARFISRHVNWKIDPLLLRVTRGRVATTLVFPTALLETRGARTGARRRNAIIYFHDGDRVIIVASNAGSPKHPAWYHNLSAHPDVTFGGIPMRATAVNDEAERERLWVLADRVFPAFASYRHDAVNAGRTDPDRPAHPGATTRGRRAAPDRGHRAKRYGPSSRRRRESRVCLPCTFAPPCGAAPREHRRLPAARSAGASPSWHGHCSYALGPHNAGDDRIPGNDSAVSPAPTCSAECP